MRIDSSLVDLSCACDQGALESLLLPSVFRRARREGAAARLAMAAPAELSLQQLDDPAALKAPLEEPGPDPSLADPALTAAVHHAFTNFLLRSEPERVLRLPPHLFMGVVTYLIHWKSLGLYGLPPPPVDEDTLLDALATLVHRYMVRQRALHGHPEPSTGPAASGAMGRELLEAALRASKASLVPEEDEDEEMARPSLASSDSEGPSDESSGDEEDDEEQQEAGGRVLPASRLRAPRARRGGSVSNKAAKVVPGVNLVDRLSEHETARKLVFDFLEPQDLAAAQSVCHRWRRMALPRAAEYFWNVLVCACWWATFPSVDSKHGCCMLEWLRREATFTESFKLKAVTVTAGCAPRLPVPRLVGGLSAASYLSGFTVAVDVADRLMDSLLASATIDLADAQAAQAFFSPVPLRDRPPEQRPDANTGFLRGWSFRDVGAAERYLNSGHESYRLEVMVIHKRSGRVACLLPADEEGWPAVGPGGMRYGIQSVAQGGRQLTVGTFGAAKAGEQLRLSFEMAVRLEEEAAEEAASVVLGEGGPRLSLCVDTVAMQLHGPTVMSQEEEDGEEEEELEEDVPLEQLWDRLALLMPHLLWH